MSQIPSNLDEKISTSMQEMTIKSPLPNHSPRCARLGWSAFGMINSSCFQSAITPQLPNATYFDEPKTPMGKRNQTSPPSTPKKKQCE